MSVATIQKPSYAANIVILCMTCPETAEAITAENRAEALQTNRTADISLAWQGKTLMTDWIPEEDTRENQEKLKFGRGFMKKTRKILRALGPWGHDL